MVTTGCCLVLLRRRDRTDWTAGSRLGWRWVAAGDRADGFPAAEPTSGLTGTRCARVRVPSGSFRMRVVQTVGAGSFASTYGTAVSVRLVAVGAPFSAAYQRWTIGIRSPALAERAVVLVHEQSSLAVKVALDFRANFLAGLVDHHRVVRRLVESLGRSARANRAAFLVSREFAIRLAERYGQTGVEVGGRLLGGHIVVGLLVGDAAADGTIVFVRLVSVFAVDRATLHRRLARGFRFDEGTVRRDRAVRTAFARLRGDRVFAGFAHRFLTDDLLLLANAAHAVGLLPSLAGLLRLLIVDTVSCRFLSRLHRLGPIHRFRWNAVVSGTTVSRRSKIRRLDLHRMFARWTYRRRTVRQAFAITVLVWYTVIWTFGTADVLSDGATEDEQRGQSGRSHVVQSFPGWHSRQN